MKSVRFVVGPYRKDPRFQVERAGLHEIMPPCVVDRPDGTGDYLLMLFHSPVAIRCQGKLSYWPASSLMIWTPEEGHYYGDIDFPWDHSWIHCAGKPIRSILRAAKLPTGKKIEVRDPTLMEKCVLDLIAELSGWRQPDDRILQNIFENFVRGLARQLLGPPPRLAPEKLLNVRAHLDQHYAEKQRLTDLARMTGWSVPHLCTEFKRFFGATLVQYLFHLRMNQAVYFLRDHNWYIGEVAEMVGYPDPYTFSKMFKRHFGLSPRTFRRQLRAGSAPG